MSDSENEIDYVVEAKKEDEERRHLYAVASQSTYMRNKVDRLKHMAQEGLEDWFLDDELSNKEHTVFVKGDKVIFAGRGTDISNKQGGRLGDLWADTLLSFGLEKLSGRYRRAKKGLEKTMKKHKGKEVVLTGHSLSGRLAIELGKKFNLETHAFNAGSTHIHAKRSLHEKVLSSVTGKKHRNKIHNYVVVGDTISNSSLFDLSMKNVIVKPNKRVKRRGPMYWHSIEHFYKNKE